MRTQKLHLPVGPVFDAARIQAALKLVANFTLLEVDTPAIKHKARDVAFAARTELRQLGKFISEWFFLSFQI